MMLSFGLCHAALACNSAAMPTLNNDLVGIAGCNANKEQCADAYDLLQERFSIGRDDDRQTLSILVRASPWHIYDADKRILLRDDVKKLLLGMLEPQMKNVELVASWSATTRAGHHPSVVQQLSQDFPHLKVSGVDGFAWLTPQGTVHGTKQAYSAWSGQAGRYKVDKNQDIMLSFFDGINLAYKPEAMQDKDADALLALAMAEETFSLCPQSALATYLQAAQWGNTIAAYNAGLILAEQGNTVEARTWLQRALQQGDKAAQQRLQQMDAGLLKQAYFK